MRKVHLRVSPFWRRNFRCTERAVIYFQSRRCVAIVLSRAVFRPRRRTRCPLPVQRMGSTSQGCRFYDPHRARLDTPVVLIGLWSRAPRPRGRPENLRAAIYSLQIRPLHRAKVLANTRETLCCRNPNPTRHAKRARRLVYTPRYRNYISLTGQQRGSQIGEEQTGRSIFAASANSEKCSNVRHIRFAMRVRNFLLWETRALL